MNYLKHIRMSAGLSQNEVADAMTYTSGQFISNWERGISCPPRGAIRLLAKLYKTPPEEIKEYCYQLELTRLRKKWGK